ncbi:amino acid adenylation domain-containing protein [Actinomadura nitritigenes]|uniref:amino acid adenylation domain-containing protein n=1 Tax=Actinomadura nitritigenes TaxID=134602 RepID=UPI003D93FF14
MTVIELLSRLRELGVRIRLDGEKLQLYASEEVLTEQLRQQIKDNRHEIVRFLRGTGQNGGPTPSAIIPMPRGEHPPLSYAQERLWFLSRLDPGSSEYNISTALQLNGVLATDSLRRALAEIAARHEVLRTTIGTTPEGLPFQNIHPPAPIALPMTDLRHLSGEQAVVEARRLIDAQANEPFDLAAEPPLRTQLIRLAENEHVLGLTLHHIASDEWSAAILRHELSALYEAYREGRPAPLGPLRIQYADYATWQRDRLSGDAVEDHVGYWREQLADLPMLALSTDRPRPPRRDSSGAVHRSVIPADTTRKLRELSQHHRTSMFITMLAAFQTMLARSTGQGDIAVGTPVAGRGHPDLEPLIGFFINTLVLRTDTSGGPTFTELLARVRRTALEAYAHQDLPFEHLVDRLHVHRDQSRHPLFDVLFSYQSADGRGGGEADRFGDLSACGFPVSQTTTQFDLNVTITDRDGVLRISAEYSTRLFDAPSIERHMARFQAVLTAVAADPEVRISEIEVVTAAERQQLMAWGRGEATSVPDRHVHELIAEQAIAKPDAAAVSGPEGVLSYRDLDRRSNRLAHELQRLGAGPETVVGVLLRRGHALVTALLATWKAGAVYLPLDPETPLTRTAFQLSDSGAGLLITTTDLLDAVPDHPAQLLVLDDPSFLDSLTANPWTPPTRRTIAESAAYLIYTSGSTGAPKAVTVPRGALSAYACWARDTYRITGSGGAPLATSIAFDMTMTSLLVPLTSGERVEIQDGPQPLLSPTYGLVKLTPSHLLSAAPDGGDGTGWPQVLVVGGEQLKGEALEGWKRAGAPGRVINEYGPTEATVGCCAHEVVASEDPAHVPIGRPVANTTLFVLDERLRAVPTGTPGELFIGGMQLARGYHNRPALTAERFVANPFSGGGERLYRTGDVARWRHDGRLEYLGRTDDQVKVRGHRVEPGEVESVLAGHPRVRAAAVVARKDASGATGLIAYFVPGGEPPDVGELRSFLRRRLPEPMIPGAFVALESLPLTTAGKLDRGALPAPGTGRPDLPAAFVEPATATEQVIADIWRGVLRIDRVGAHDDFFDLGGHSLYAAQVVAQVRARLEAEVPVAAIFDAPTLTSFAAVVDQAAQAGPSPAPISADRSRPLELSFAQQRLWFLSQLNPGGTEYHVPVSLQLKGRLDIPSLRGALNALVARHEVLRTTIIAAPDGTPAQSVAPSLEVDLAFTDLSGRPAAEAHAKARQEVIANAGLPFDLGTAPPWRVRLIRIAEQEHVLCAVFHHIVFDEWSMRIFVDELSDLYEAFHEGVPSPLEPLRIQYADYAAWQRGRLTGEAFERQLDYWRDHLSGLPVLDLPSDRPRSRERDPAGAQYTFRISVEKTEKLRRLSRRAGTSMFMTLLAGFQALLARYTGQDDIPVGTMVAGRTHPATERLIGFFVNTLVLRTDVSGDPTFAELLVRVRRTALDAYTHQEVPFEHLVEVLQPARDRGRNPLFDVMFAYEHINRDGRPAPLGHLDICGFPAGHTTSKFDLSLSMAETGDLLQGGVEYNTALFDEDTIRRLIGHLTTLLDAMADGPDQHVADAPLMTPPEREGLERLVSGPTSPAVPDALVHELVAEHVRTTPGKLAVAASGEALTYKQLDEAANRLAHLLRKHGVQPESVVALCLGRTPRVLTSALATMKAGGIYLPLDPDVPAQRLRFQLEDSHAVVVVTTADLLERIPEDTTATLLILDDPATATALDRQSTTAPAAKPSPDCGAYLIYTSGSTGNPKGTIGTHRNLVYLHHAWTHTHGLPANDTLLTTANLTFDAFTGDWVRALTSGATLHIGPDRRHLDPTHLADLLTRHHITALETTPHQLAALTPHLDPHNPPPLKTLIVTADTWYGNDHTTTRTALPHTHLLTSYGLTETSVDTTLSNTTHHQPHPHQTLTIGQPLPHTTVHLLDSHLQPVPTGIPGEIYIGGTGLTRGYHHQPTLTAQRFIPNPLTNDGTRLYRTGDQARRNPDGTLHFLGRTDHQINLRGHRIEPTEIEQTLTTHPTIHTAAVITGEDPQGESRLIAYAVPSDVGRPPTVTALREHLRSRLLDHMVPSAFVFLDRLPLTTTGKIDRKALPSPGTDRPELSGAYEPPRTPTERALSDVWAEVLGLDRVGAHDDFFDLGGHSILAARIVMRARTMLDVDLPLAALFDAPTVAGLAAVVDAAARVAPPAPIPPRDGTTAPRLSFAQQRLWFLNQLEPASSEYHVPMALQLSGNLHVEALGRSLAEIVRRHEVLRTTITTGPDGIAVQEVHPPGPADLPLTDVSGLPPDRAQAEASRVIDAEAAQPFDLASAPPFRARLIRLAASEHVLCVTFHHIASDEWSAGIFAHELSSLYAAFREGRPSPLTPLPLQYADFAAWQRTWLTGDVLERQLDYWRGKLADLPTLRLPTDRPHPPVRRPAGRVRQFPIPAETADRLRALNRRTGTSMFMALLAGFQALLARYTGQDDIAVGTPVGGRTHPDTEHLIGFFTNTLVLRTDASGNPSFAELLSRVRRTALDGFAHQDLPFEHLVEELQPHRDRARHPLFQVMFNYAVNNGDDRPGLAGIDACGFPVGYTATPFDLALSIGNSAGDLHGTVEYSTALFDDTTIEQLTVRLTALLEAVAADPEQHLSEIPLATGDELERLKELSHGPSNSEVPGCLIHELVVEQARTAPTKVAVAAGADVLTYAELDAEANRIAHLLHRNGIGPESVVALLLDREVRVLTSILGVLKAGGIYQPIDPETPAERLGFLVSDSRAVAILTTTALRGLLPSGESPPMVIAVDEPETRSALDSSPATPPAVHISPDGGAYLIYTSGSTGNPKGTIGTHRNLVYLHHAWTHTHGLPANDTLLTTANLTFDAFTGDWVRALTSGATLHIGPDRRHLDPTHLADLLTRHHITALETTPHQLAALTPHLDPHNPPPLKTLIVTADTWYGNDHTTTRTALPHTHLLTSYGLTETSVDTTLSNTTHHQPHPHQTLTIGQPLPHTTVHLLDSHLQPVPTGIPGEIYIGGTGLTRGYHHQPTLTAQRFIPNPLTNDGTRLYRTGDQARRNPDGTLHFLGRTDHQINLRGHRIEPTEIEQTLTTHPTIHTAAVTVHQEADTPGGQRLIAYIGVSGAPPTTTDLRAHLKARLPDHMVPSVYILLDPIPTTATGKIDRNSLPAPAHERPLLGNDFADPATPAEHLLASIWREVLKLDRVGVHDDFFDLGGDSILSLQIIARARAAGLHITPAQLFDNPTVARLSAVAVTAAPEPPDQGRLSGPVGLLPIHRWWADQRLPRPEHFNQATWLRAGVHLDPSLLERAASAVADHHDALRLRASGYPDRLRLTIATSDQPPVRHHRLPSGCDDHLRRERLAEIAQSAQESLNLATGPIWRLELVEEDTGGSRVLLIVHHLAIDTVSWDILIEDLARAYTQVAGGLPVDLGPKTTSIGQWADHVSELSRDEQTAAGWPPGLGDATPEPLPVDHEEGPTTYEYAGISSVHLDTETTAALIHEAPRAYRTQINDLLLAALTQALYRWAGIRCATVELEGHGRTHTGPHDLSRTMGWFTTLTPIGLVHPDSAEDLAGLIKTTKETLRAAPRHGLPPDAPDGDRPQIGFNYHGRLDVDENRGPRATAVGNALWRPTGGPTGAHQDAETRLPYLLDFTAAVTDGRLHVHLTYPVTRYRRETADALTAHFLHALSRIVAHTEQVALNAPGAATPSDFPLATLAQAQIDDLVATTDFVIEDAYPVSPMQHGMLFHTLLAPSSGVYFEHTVLTFEGSMDPGVLQAAFQHLVDRHPILRTAVRHHDQVTPLQLVATRATMPFAFHDWTGLAQEQHDAKLAEFLADDRAGGIDLTRPPMARLALIRHEEARHTLVLAEHHLLMDGWSLPILIDELQTTYAALANGKPPVLRTRRPYRDYIDWLADQNPEDGLEFWRSQLAGFTAPTPLATDPPGSGGHMTLHRELTTEATQRLTDLARSHRLTPNTLIRGAFALLISRHTGSDDICYGATVSGRPDTLPGVEHMLGVFINTLPVRLRLPSDATLLDFLRQVQEQQIQQQSHQHVPLTSIRTVSRLAPNVPLFDTNLVVHNYPRNDAGRARTEDASGPRLCGIFGDPADHYPLSVMADVGHRLRLTFSFDGSQHAAETVERLAAHLIGLLENMEDDLHRPIADVSPALEPERSQVRAWAVGSPAAGPAKLLPAAISERATAQPGAAAVIGNGRTLSYAQLEESANRTAHLLSSMGAGPETVVAIILDSGPEMVQAMLGVWKSGAAYLPIDPASPLTRIGSHLIDAAAHMVITTTDLLDRLPDQPVPLVLLDDPTTMETIRSCPATPPAVRLHADNAAYLIYTSGSTGTPKAVTVPHGGLASYIHHVSDRLSLHGAAQYAISQQLTVDFGNTLLYAALSRGGTVHLLETASTLHGLRFADRMERAGIDYLKITPSHLRALLAGADNPAKLLPRKALILGGETAPDGLTDTLRTLVRENGVDLHNHYGPTETCVGATTHNTGRRRSGMLPIGRPLPGTSCHVLDPQLRPVPVGVPGELFIGGGQVARGYHGRPHLTAERFIPDPFSGDGSRLYRTGDLVRWGEDGQLQFLRRADDQMKVRGHRVEPGEIEAALAAHPTVGRAAVAVRPGGSGDRLVAHLVPADSGRRPVIAEVRAFLGTRLPSHMIPSVYVLSETLPMTPSGKIDRRALPDAGDGDSAPAAAHRPLTTPTERTLAAIWREVLGIERVGGQDDFFDLGGHSLLATQVIARLHRELGVDLPIAAVFDAPTLAAQAAAIDAVRWVRRGAAPAASDDYEEVEL